MESVGPGKGQTVFPAKAGIQKLPVRSPFSLAKAAWIPAFAGITGMSMANAIALVVEIAFRFRWCT